MAQVSVRKVVKAYETYQAVHGIDLDIADEEFVVLVGPSGCGKSTTLRMIAGLEDITSGEIWIGGDMVNDMPPRDRDIAMVFQNYALYPHMTVYDNMAFGLKLRKFAKPEIKSRVANAAKVLDIEPLLARRPKALSGGQRQRVAMGAPSTSPSRAIGTRPAWWPRSTSTSTWWSRWGWRPWCTSSWARTRSPRGSIPPPRPRPTCSCR